jgi:hypothetical protein
VVEAPGRLPQGPDDVQPPQANGHVMGMVCRT